MGLRNIDVAIRANSGSLRSQLSLASKEIDAFATKARGAGAEASKAGLGGLAMKAGFTLAAAAVAYSVVQATKFETQMRNVNSISHLSEGTLKSLSAQVIDLSKNVPQSAETLASGLYDIASSGYQGADGLTILKAAATAASAGLTDTATASQAIVSVINAYGMSAKDAGYVSDVLFQTVNLGVVSFEQLAGSIGDVIPMASQAGVTVDQVGSAIATMTLSGLSGAESATRLQRTIQALITPTDALQQQIESWGYSNGQAAIKALGLHGVMVKIGQATHGDVAALKAFFPDIRSASGAMALLANNGANYNRVAGEIENKTKVAGATQRAFSEQMKSLSAQFKLFLNNVNAAAITVGTVLLPVLKDALSGTLDLAHKGVAALQSAWKDLRPIAQTIADAIGNVTDIIGQMIDYVRPAATFVAQLVAAFAVGSLMVFADALKAITGFLKDHPALIQAATVALIAFGVQALVARVNLEGLIATRLGVWAIDAAEGIGRIVYGLMALAAANGGGLLGAARAGAVALGTALETALSSPLLPAALLALAVISARNELNHMKKNAEEAAKAVERGLDPTKPSSYVNALRKAQDAVADNQKALDGYEHKNNSVWGRISSLWSAPERMMHTKQLQDNLGASGKELDKLRSKADTLATNLGKVWANVDTSGVDRSTKATMANLDTLAAFAAKNGIDITKPYKEWGAALQDAWMKSMQLTPTQATLATSFQTVASDTAGATDKLKAFKDAMDAVIGTELGAFDSATKWGKSVNDLTDSLKANGLTIDSATKQGQANRDALSAAAQAAVDDANAVAQQKDSVAAGNEVLAAHVKQLRDVMGQMGLNTQQQDLYLAALGLTPDNIATLVQLNGKDAALQGLGDVKTKADDVGATKPIVHVDADTGQAEDKTSHWWNSWNGKHLTLTADVIKGAWTNPFSYADGGMVSYYADGAHVAQVAPAGAMRVWAEPETGGEAYIPLSPAKRQRSTAVLGATAAHFGYGLVKMAGGGIVHSAPTSGAAGGPGPMVHTTLIIQGNIYGEAELKRRVNSVVDDRDAALARKLRSNR